MKINQFVICYSLKGKRVVFTCASKTMTDNEASYLACLHSVDESLAKRVHGKERSNFQTFHNLKKCGVSEVLRHRALHSPIGSALDREK